MKRIRIKLTAKLSGNATIKSVYGFLSWWEEQLRAMLPAPWRERRAVTGWTRKQSVLAIAALVAWGAAAVLAPVMRNAELSSLAADIAHLRGPASSAAAMLDKLRIMEQPATAAAARLSRPDPLDMMRLLSDLLPRDTQLGEIEIDDKSVRLVVIGGDARRAAAALERSGKFSRTMLQVPAGRGAFRIEFAR